MKTRDKSRALDAWDNVPMGGNAIHGLDAAIAAQEIADAEWELEQDAKANARAQPKEAA